MALELSQLDGSNGFRLDGVDADDESGRSVSGAGDVNGDGFDDVIIGAYAADPNGIYSGESYVVFGSPDVFASSLDLSALDGSNGFRLTGIDVQDYSGISVSGAGDVNGDGFDDVIIGAYAADPQGRFSAGESYVVFGSPGGFASSLDLSALNGSNGFRIDGADRSDDSGFSVSGAGDVNGDGIDDMIIGARTASPDRKTYAGESYVVFGSSEDFASSLDLFSLDGSNGFRIGGIDEFDRSGESVSGAGDVNGDGFDDVIVGASGAEPHGLRSAGESYVIFGSASGFASSLNLSSLDGSNGFLINGVNRDDSSGISVSGAGDVNGDGFDDVIVGASGAEPHGLRSAGESYVIFGSASGFASSLNLSSLDGSNGFLINGVNRDDSSGRNVSGAGDVNGDGIDDVIISAHRADPDGKTFAGESYVLFGSSTSFAPSLDLSSLDGSNGFRIVGIDVDDFSGISVSSAGDVNNDGFDDVIMGAYRADPGGRDNAGESYVVFGFWATSRTPDLSVEAESFTIDAGFTTQNNGWASANATLRAPAGDSGEQRASYTFTELSGNYDLTLGYFDESDGQSSMSLLVNGVVVDSFVWDLDAGSSNASQSSAEIRAVADVALETGDKIELVGFADAGERLRVDYLDFYYDGPSGPDTTPPVAQLASARNVTALGGAGTTVSVTYADGTAVDVSTIDVNDITVTGPAGSMPAISNVSLDVSSDGPVRTATYTIAAPGGRWDAGEEGVYTVTLNAGEVEDTGGFGNEVVAALTSFYVVSTPPPAPFRVEAESFAIDAGFTTQNNGWASADATLRAQAGDSGEQRASYTFSELSGNYDLTLGYFDESDGQSSMSLLVNGVVVDSFVWDLDAGSSNANASAAATRAIADVALETGDTIELVGFADAGERLRADYLDFTYDSPIA